MARDVSHIQGDQSYAVVYTTGTTTRARLVSGSWEAGAEDERALTLILGLETGVNDDYNDKFVTLRIRMRENALAQEKLPTPGSDLDLTEGGPR